MLNGDSSQASETTPVAVTKKSIRVQVWQHLLKNQLYIRPPFVSYHHRIPSFVNSPEAAQALKDLDIFKNAKNVLVNPDKAQDSVRLACLQSGKTLYIQSPRPRAYLTTRLTAEEGATEVEMTESLTLKGLKEHGTQIDMESMVPMDLVVVGSVAVSRDGHRVGRGNGNVDLYLSLLAQIKSIHPETLIVTTVHDSQILDSIPTELMGPHDFPVDVIVTPTQVINVQKPVSPRPTGILWNLLSERRLRQHPLISQLREKDIESGNVCTLKEVESDVETGRENSGRRFFKGRRNPRYRRSGGANGPQTNGTHSESERYETAEGENGGQTNRKPTRSYPKRYHRFHRQSDDGVITKRSFRNKAWQLLQRNRVTLVPRVYYSCIPTYKGTEDAAQLLKQMDVFKNATSILVNKDMTHESFRMACLEEGKKLYVLLPRLINDIVLRIDVPEGDDKPALKDVITRQGLERYGKALDLNDEFKIDLLIVGSVAVSKEGYRIGKGNGYMDLCYGVLSHMKAISPDTPIITTVHDYQVFETLPTDLFLEHDIPIDWILTPTQVIDTQCAHKKPTAGLVWGLLTERRLKSMPCVIELRDKEILAGKPCELKEVDPDEKSRVKRRDHFRRSTNHSESEQNDMGEAESGDHGGKPNNRRRYGRQRRSTNDKGEESGGNISPDTTSRVKRRPQFRKPKMQVDFSIKVTNIERNVRIRDLRSALQERSVKPNLITWKGFKGFCYLHFAKPVVQTGEGDCELNPDAILESLANLTIYPSDPNQDSSSEPPLPNKLLVQLRKPPLTRIETADETAV